MMDQPPRPIDQSPDYERHLRGLIHSRYTLQSRGYVLDQLPRADLNRKRRCQNCCRVLEPKGRLEPKTQAIKVNAVANALANATLAEPTRCDKTVVDKKPEGEPEKTPLKVCKYHPGQVAFKKWTCCDGFLSAPPCRADEKHTPRIYAAGEIEDNWSFFKTPMPRSSQASSAVAVAIDCEMGVADSGESELIRISVIDYFSGAVLLDRLVFPDVKMKHYNTRYSGISRQAMQDAQRRRACLFGRKNARKAVWSIVGPDTIIVGHAAHSDLTSLRWIHPTVVDTLLIEEAIVRAEKAKMEAAKAEKERLKDGQADEEAQTPTAQKVGVGLSLKALAQDRLKREIQIKGQGHDSVEDALATRDILHWHIMNRVQ